MGINDYFGRWVSVIDYSELKKVTDTLDMLYNKVSVTPFKKDVFKAFNLCPYSELKVVMLGQDPYPQKNIATGILFGNSLGTSEDTLSPSLKVIKDTILGSIPRGIVSFDNSMESWAKQGILMLNSALTVEVNKVGSHTILWRGFISKLLQNISLYNPNLIYVLYGTQAKTFRPYINKNSTIFEVPHPAYFARLGKRFETDLFDQINVKLKQSNNTQIKWYDEIL